jgi:hypothetical protein
MMARQGARMKKLCSALALCAALLSAGGCSRDRAPASFDGVFGKLVSARNFSEAKHYYTRGTIGAIDEAVRDGAISDKDRLRVLPLFNNKTRWEEVSRKIEGSRGEIRLRYTEHPVENMVGQEMPFRLTKESGSWKIDLEDEIRQALKGHERGSAADYIRRISKRY